MVDKANKMVNAVVPYDKESGSDINNTDEDDYMNKVKEVMKKNFGYDFNVGNCNTNIAHEIVALLSYLKIIFEQYFNANNEQSNINNSNQIIYSRNDNNIVNNNYIYIDNSSNSEVIKTEENNFTKRSNNGEPFMISSSNQSKPTKIGNKMLLGIPHMETISGNICVYKFYKPTYPIYSSDIKLLKTNNNNNQIDLNTYMNDNSSRSQLQQSIIKEEENEIVKYKEEIILNTLHQLSLINDNIKTPEIIYKRIIPLSYDGIYVSKLINLLEGNKVPKIKGLSKDTYIKNNIKRNWETITSFLNNKPNYVSELLFKENFWEDRHDLFQFIYEIISYYIKHKKASSIKLKHLEKEMVNKYNKYINNRKHTLSNYENSSVSFTHINNVNTRVNTNETKTKKEVINKGKAFNNNNNIVHNYDKCYTSNNSFQRNSSTNLKNMKNYSLDDLLNIRKHLHSEYDNISKLKHNNKQQHIQQQGINNVIKIQNKARIPFPCKKNNNKPNIPLPCNNYSKQFKNRVESIIEWLDSIRFPINKVNFYVSEMEEFKDGILLYQIISLVETNLKLLPKIEFFPQSSEVAIKNINSILQMLMKYKKDFHFGLQNKEKEIYNGSPHVILNLLECIRSVYSDTNFNVEGVNNRSKSLNNSVLINYNY